MIVKDDSFTLHMAYVRAEGIPSEGHIVRADNGEEIFGGEVQKVSNSIFE